MPMLSGSNTLLKELIKDEIKVRETTSLLLVTNCRIIFSRVSFMQRANEFSARR